MPLSNFDGDFIGINILPVKDSLAIDIKKPSLRAGAPANNRFILMGDSRPNADWGQSAGLLTTHAVTGIGTWLEILTGHRIRCLKADNVAVSGAYSTRPSNTALGVLETQLPAALLKSAANVMMLLSTNDRTASSPALTAAETIAAYRSIIDSLLAAGKWLYIVTELPRGNSGFTAQRLASGAETDHATVRAWLNSLNHPRVMLIDAYAALSDAVWNGGLATDIAAQMAYDGLHQASYGAYTIADLVAARLIARFSTPDPYAWSIADLYNATTNPGGNLLANSEMSGTAGTGVDGSAILGQVATGFTAAVSSFTGLTMTCSKVADGDGNAWQEVRIQGNAGAGTPVAQIRRNITFANVTVGDILDARADFEIGAGQVGLKAAEFGLVRLSSGTTRGYSRAMGNAADPFPVAAISGKYRIGETVAILGDENTVQFTWNLYPRPSTNGIDFTARLRHPFIGKVGAAF